jgi:hypothetical protein
LEDRGESDKAADVSDEIRNEHLQNTRQKRYLLCGCSPIKLKVGKRKQIGHAILVIKTQPLSLEAPKLCYSQLATKTRLLSTIVQEANNLT